MSEVKFSNNDVNFKNFAKEAIKLASSNDNQQNSLQKLENTAYNNDGFISTKERLLIQSFRENPKVLTNLSISALDSSFSLDIKENPIRKKLEPKDTALDFARSNPLEANVYDPGITKLNAGVELFGAKPELKLQEALNKLGNSQISAKANNFISSLDSESHKKYASAYITELITNRQPKLSENEVLNLLNKVEDISKTDYPEEIGNGKDLAMSSLHDISFPSDVSQNNSGTCVATSAQIQMILRSPDKYLEMIDNLAKNKPYDTPKGSLKPNWTFSKPFERTARTISSSLAQNALMNEGRGNYDSSVINSVSSGLFLNQAKKMYETMLGKSVTTKSLREGFSRADLFKSINDSKPSLNNPVHVTIDYMDSGRDRSHAVNVVSLKSDSVTIINPWGREETFSPETLKNKLLEVILVNKK